MSEIWSEEEVTQQQERIVLFGDLSLKVRLQGEEVWLSKNHPHDYKDSMSSPSPTWQRYVLKNAIESLRFKPKLPDRSLLVRPDQEFRVLPGVRVKVFVTVPLFVNVQTNTGESLGEYSTRRLSDSWFGNYHDGELCYSLPSSVRREAFDKKDSARAIAVCPVRIRNKSSKELIVTNLCIRVSLLSLFSLEDQFVTNEILITHLSDDQPSDIHVGTSMPTDASLIMPARESSLRKVSMKSFVSMLRF